MTENKALNQKIKILKKSHQISSSAANPHNTFLDEKEAEQLKNDTSIELNVWDNILEWYIRTLGDELYKLAFINKDKYYRIKAFWPQDYEAFLIDQNNHNAMQVENENQNKVKQLDNVRYYFSQFQNFEIEDYFDVIIFPKIDKQTKVLTLKFLVNPFTYLLSVCTKETLDSKSSKIDGLELFIENEECAFKSQTTEILSELTNFILSKYVIRQENKSDQIIISPDQLRKRIAPIIKEETRVVLYELYKDL